jgi:type II secretory ATPase GspE/PulE/Tfp pilus assembly ATPase PilB-like protein
MVRAFGGPDALASAFGASSAGDLEIWIAPGCEACGGSGYKGRMALHELLVADDDLRAVIARRGTMDETRALATRTGMATLLQDGVAKAIAGDTDLRQVLAVCSR